MEMRSYQDLIKKAESLKKLSSFKLAEMKKLAEQGEGPLAGLSRFEISCVMALCEENRKSKEK